MDQQVLLKQIIEDDINAVQDDYVLNIEFHAGNDQNIATALAANSGPDIVFTSGPSYVTTTHRPVSWRIWTAMRKSMAERPSAGTDL